MQQWEQKAKEHQKQYKRLLDKANQPKAKKIKNDILHVLPQLHEHAFEQIDCLSCARCCKNHSPRFKQPDIKRIAKRLKLKEGVFIEKYLKLDNENDFVTQTQPCPFLAVDNTCNIYEDRPGDCARYPYTDEDVLIHRKTLTLKNTMVCPITFTVMEKLLELHQ